jgi:hypothetical protein
MWMEVGSEKGGLLRVSRRQFIYRESVCRRKPQNREGHRCDRNPLERGHQ